MLIATDACPCATDCVRDGAGNVETRLKAVEYTETMWAEMKPDCYRGNSGMAKQKQHACGLKICRRCSRLMLSMGASRAFILHHLVRIGGKNDRARYQALQMQWPNNGECHDTAVNRQGQR